MQHALAQSNEPCGVSSPQSYTPKLSAMGRAGHIMELLDSVVLNDCCTFKTELTAEPTSVAENSAISPVQHQAKACAWWQAREIM